MFNNISITSITSGLFYPFLRKPDFQRETNEWDAKKIAEFIESFINGELIPAIILWRNNAGLYFDIDGAHRLSALISWIKDDYGFMRLIIPFLSTLHLKIFGKTYNNNLIILQLTIEMFYYFY